MQYSAEDSLLMVYLNCFSSHMNLISASSSGSLHFNSTVEQSTTSGFMNKPLASLYSQSSGAGCFCRKTSKTYTNNQDQTPLMAEFLNCSRHQLTLGSMLSRISSMQPCCLIRSMALFGPIPLMVPQ